MKIGELLLAKQLIDRATLARALLEQPRTEQRLCSMLIARKLLDPDDAARALAEQHGLAGVLQRHLAGRDPEVAKLLPAELARTSVALPVGRMRDGELIICVRDPIRGLIPQLEAATKSTVVLAIAPATQLEQLVITVYGRAPSGEFDVEIGTRPMAVVAELGPLHLVDLDDTRVKKDPTQTGPTLARTVSGTPALPRTMTAPQPPRTMTASQPPRTTTPPTPPRRERHSGQNIVPLTLPATVAAIENATTRDEAIDSAMTYATVRWPAALLLAVREGAALGVRGHGPHLTEDAVQAIAIPLGAPSIVKAAHDTRQLATSPPPGSGAVQERLSRLLGAAPCAAPIFVGAHVTCVLAIGADAADDDAAGELERVASAMGTAFTRIMVDAKKS
jgi:hypothetical protein